MKPSRRRKTKKQKGDKMKKATPGSSPLTDELSNTLSNAIVLYFSAHRAHWNVEGVDFFEYHSLFEEIYSDTYGSIDSFAENIRKMGGFPPNLSDMEDSAIYEDASATSDARELAMDLYSKNKDFIGVLKRGFDVANSANEQGVANFYAERIDMHEKWDWQLRSSLGISSVQPEAEMEDEGEIEDSDIMAMLNELLNVNKSDSKEFDKETDFIKMQDSSLQNDVKYDTILNMDEQEYKKLSILKRFVNWLVQDVEETASTESKVEVTENTLEEEMDIEVLKDALSAVVDEKLANFATSIKEEVEATVQEKIDDIAKSFEVQKTELEEKLSATEKALAEQEETVKSIATSGAVKKSVDTEEDDDEIIVKSASNSVWNNVYLPQGLITALGYES